MRPPAISTSIILETLRTDLRNSANEKNRISIQKFFKQEVQCYGLKSSEVNVLAKAYFKWMQPVTKSIIFELCEALWQSGFQEECMIACQWSARIHSQYEASDFVIFRTWIEKYVTNWATCDTFCNHTVGGLLLKYPHLVPQLQGWAVSDLRWLRRAAAVSLIIPARKGLFWNDISTIAHLQLTDADDMIQKGYGWLLKVASKSHEEEVFAFIMEHRACMPRIALRYAIEKMPAPMKALAMKK